MNLSLAHCVDCERRVELHEGRCPICGGASVMQVGGVASRFARLPFLRRIKPADVPKPPAKARR